MQGGKQIQKPKKKKEKKETDAPAGTAGVTEAQKRKLEELDGFIEGVLREAGEEFLDEFRQVEGE